MQKSILEQSAAVARGAYSPNTARITLTSSCIHATDQCRDHGENLLPYSRVNALISTLHESELGCLLAVEILSDAQLAFKKFQNFLLLEKEETQSESSWS